MGRTYMYRVLGNDQYEVLRIDDKLPHGKRFKSYLIDLKNPKGALCSCESFMYRKKQCKHIKTIIENLKAGGGILDFQHEGDYDKLFAMVKRKEEKKCMTL